MKESMVATYVYTFDNVRFSQFVLLFATTGMILLNLLFLIIDFKISALFFTIFQAAVFFLINYYYGRNYYEVKIDMEGVIHARNLWRSERYLVKDLHKIGLQKFPFPYPLNPYIFFRFKNNKRIIARVENPFHIHFRNKGMGAYLKNMKAELTRLIPEKRDGV